MGGACSQSSGNSVDDTTEERKENENETAQSRRQDRAIGSWMNEQKQQDRFNKKLLLLGSGSAGKSTLFRKLRSIHIGGLSQPELEGARPTIRQNIVFSIIVLLQQSQLLYEANQDKYFDCFVELTPELQPRIEIIMQYSDDDFGNEMDLDYNSLAMLGESIEFIWNLNNIRNVYRKRGTLFSMPDNMDYFLSQVRNVMKREYVPTEDDHLKTRARTVGMTDYIYQQGKHSFHIYDVGGQRAERRKWIHHFDNVNALIYVAALNHYNAVLFEDNKVNAMLESVQLFEQIINNKYLRQSEAILLLNKDDLFRQKLRHDSIPLTVCFSKAGGWPNESEYWTDGHYTDDPNLSEAENNANFETFHDSAIDFIENIYKARNKNAKKWIYKHITIATDQSHVQKVFWDVQNIVVRGNMAHAGLISATPPFGGAVESKQNMEAHSTLATHPNTNPMNATTTQTQTETNNNNNNSNNNGNPTIPETETLTNVAVPQPNLNEVGKSNINMVQGSIHSNTASMDNTHNTQQDYGALPTDSEMA